MHQSKLVTLLKTFRTRDYRRFREFLHSPYFNKRQDLVDFYRAVESFAPDFAPEQLDPEKLWQAYSPKAPFDQKELTYLANFLLKKAEHYLAVEMTEQDETSRGIRFLEYCMEFNLPKHYRATLLRTRKDLQAEPFRDSLWHLKAWRLADVEMQQFYTSRSRKADGSINRVMDHLDAFYLDRRLELGAEVLSLNQMFKEQYDTSFVDGLLHLLSTRSESETTVRMRRLILQLAVDPEDFAAFSELLELLPQAGQFYPPDREKGIFAYAQNHCIRRIKLGDQRYDLQLFRIYQQSIASGVIYETGELSPWDFKNVCSIALKLGEYDWTGQFISGNEHRIAAEFRGSAIAYNRANLYFHQKRFDLALRSLSQVEYSDVFYALDTRRIMLIIYYERGDAEAFFSLITSFRAYLARNKAVSQQHQQSYKNFIDWAARLFRLLPAELKERRDALRAELEATEPVTDRPWLLGLLT